MIPSKKYTIILISILLLISCSIVKFDKPHPSDQKILNGFDSEFIGKYYWADKFIENKKKNNERIYNLKYFFSNKEKFDSIVLFSADINITDKLAEYSLNFWVYYKISKFDTSRIKKLYNNEGLFIQGKYIVHKEKTYYDTLLNINKNDKLILYNNKYYLNHLIYKAKSVQDSLELSTFEESWQICQFENKGSNIYSLNITNDQDYKMLFDDSKTWQPIFPLANISDEKFKKFVAKGGFHQKFKIIKYTN